MEQGGVRAELGLDSEEFCDGTHTNMVLAGLDVLRRENTFTDVRIKVEEAEFPVHKCVLSSFSPYFKAMFTTGLAETDQEVVTLNGVEPGMISGLLYYAYTGTVTITKPKLMNKTKI